MDADAFESDAPVQIERMLMKPSDMDSAVVTRTTTKFRPQGGATYGEVLRIGWRPRAQKTKTRGGGDRRMTVELNLSTGVPNRFSLKNL